MKMDYKNLETLGFRVGIKQLNVYLQRRLFLNMNFVLSISEGCHTKPHKIAEVMSKIVAQYSR